MKKITQISGGGGCPERYTGTLDTGEKFYVRYRWGCGTIEINDELVAEINAPGDPYKGYFDEGELKMLFVLANIEFDETLIK